MKWFGNVVVLAIVSVLSVVVVGYPSGAGNSSCKDLQPGHPSSNEINESIFLLVNPGQGNSMEVTIKPQNASVTFKGFLLRVIMDEPAQGKFNPDSTSQYHSLCTNETMSAVTHSNSIDKPSVTVKFDVTQSGQFTFEATVVFTYNQHVSGLITITRAELPQNPTQPIQISYL
ncbi:hypothetical protein Pmani_028546 [Petrolisthes manimaculis]|uniref:Reelin domain-containing protein n=1 Tax=Petrolisthes manimaculis TaxID=1843537 RepID=A0AAE1P1Y3_9EUCA|nr:hypothetical protein Pmani_028546 [Petrolisthes manimaculis]